MPMLNPTEILGRVDALLVNPDRDSDLTSEQRERVTVTYAGFEGEAHGGLTRPSCSRVLAQYPQRGTEIKNARQVSMVSSEELADVAVAMGIPAIDPAWIGANLLLSGIPAFTTVPPASRLVFEGGVSLVVDMENGPCRFPGDIMEGYHPGKGRTFAKHAQGRRGVVGWVEKTGEIAVGERVRLHVPPQRLYAPLQAQGLAAQ